MTPPTPNPWNSPATISAVVAAISAGVAIWQAIRAAKSSKRAKESEEKALRTQQDIATQLTEANRISKGTHELFSREAKHELELTVQEFLAPENHQYMSAVVWNKSLSLSATVDYVGFSTGPDGQGGLVIPTSVSLMSDDKRTISAHRKLEFTFDAIVVAREYQAELLRSVDTLYVAFEHGERVTLRNADIAKFLEVAIMLSAEHYGKPVTYLPFSIGGDGGEARFNV